MERIQVQKARQAIVILVAFATVLTAGFVAWTVRDDRGNTIRSASLQAAGYARALDEHAGRALSEGDDILRSVIRRFEKRGGVRAIRLEDLQVLLREETSSSPQIASVIAVSPEGRLFAHSLPSPVTADVRDRDYFVFHRDTPEDALFLSSPLKSRVTGKWRFTLTRRMSGAGGRFDGIVGATFDVDSFARFYESIARPLGPGCRIALIRRDGHPVLLHPFDEKVLSSGAESAGGSLLPGHLPRRRAGTFVSRGGEFDNAPRIVSYRQLENFPAVAVVAPLQDDVLADWRKRAWISAGIAALLLAGVWGLAGVLLRRLRDLEESLEREKVLGGLLPICMYCKKIRDDAGYWQRIEEYIRHHSQAEFSHGMCPDCAAKHYPGYVDEPVPSEKPPP